MRKLDIPKRPCVNCGSLFRPRPRRDQSQRFCSMVCRRSMTVEKEFACWSGTPPDAAGCIVWSGTLHEGYGQLVVSRTSYRAHRVAWELVHGPIPEEMLVCHHCDNPPCVNEKHLFLGTNDDNIADRDAKGRRADTHGSRNPYAKLTESQVVEIRNTPKRYGVGLVLAARFGVCVSRIYNIRARRSWTHV